MNIKVKAFLSSIITFLIIIISNNVYAASASLKVEKTKLEPGQSTKVTVSVSNAEAWNLKVTANGGTLFGTTVNADAADGEVSKEVISATFTASAEGTYTISLSGQVTGSDLVKKDVAGTNVTVTYEKPAPTPTPDPDPEPTPDPDPDPEPTPDPKPTVVEFTTINETVYATGTVNVRKSYSAKSESLGQLKEGDSVTRTGVSKTTAEGYYWSKINFNGTTAYVISSKLTTTKPEEKPAEQPKEEPKEEPKKEPTQTTENKPVEITAEPKDGLKSLEIEGVTLSPEFKPNVYEYRVIVKKDVSELAISAIPAVEGATVVIAGNKDLKEGENLITIVVYNNKGEAATYQITTNKSTIDLTETDEILKEGTESAQRNLIMFAALLATAIVALIVVSILRGKNEAYENEGEEELNPEESTIDEQIVENIDENQENKEETSKFKKEKKKGKHF